MLIIHGIKNCSTMKKAFDWLDAEGLEYRFHDYKKNGISADTLEAWVEAIGWEELLNTKGTTWRTLSDEERTNVDTAKAIALMQSKPSLIRRPVISGAGSLVIGFDPARYAELLKG